MAMGNGAFLGVKQAERGADHPPHSSAGLRMVRNYIHRSSVLV
jgi:hypothetical protein